MMKVRINYKLCCIFAVFMSMAGCTTTGANTEEPSLSDVIPESRTSALEQAIDAERDKQFDKAIVLYVKALGLEPKTHAKPDELNAEQTMSDIQIVYKIGILEIKQGHIELAKTAFNHVLSIDPDHGPSQTQLGIINLGQKDKITALSLLTKAITSDQLRLAKKQSEQSAPYTELDSMSPLPAYSALAVIHDLDGQHIKAIELFSLVLHIKRQDPLIFTNLGYSQYLSGNLIEAELNFKRAIDLDPQFERAWLNLGLVYVRKGMYNKAFQTLKQIMPAAHASNDIGYFLMLEGRYSEAEYFLQYAIELSPTYFVKANINLEHVRLNLNRDVTVANADKNNKNTMRD